MTKIIESTNAMQNHATRIQIASSFILKLKIFMRTLQMMLKKDLIHQIMNLPDHYQ